MSFMLLGILQSQAAGGGAGGYDLLETTTLSGSASSVTFSGLGSYSDYAHLQIRAIGRNSLGASGATAMRVQFNSDTGANYSEHRLFGNGSSIQSAGLANAGSIDFGAIPYNSSTANAYGVSVLDILDFSNSSKYKTTRALSGLVANLGAGNTIALRSGNWRNLNAITSMTFTTDNGSFVANSRFSIYGVK